MEDLCVTATRDHNVYESFRPSIATKDAETHSKMNTDALKIILKIHKKLTQIQSDTHTKESTCGLLHICKKGENSLQ